MLTVSNLVGFGAAREVVAITDHGDATGANVSSGGTFGSLTSTGDFSVLIFSWEDGVAKNITGLSVGGQAMSIQANTGNNTTGVAIATYAGTVSGAVGVTYSSGIDIEDAAATLVSLTRLNSYSVKDTDTGTTSLGSLTSPGVGGIRIVGSMDATDTAQNNWSGIDAELSDISGGNGGYRHSAAYHIANSAASIGNSDAERMAGISIGLS